MKIEEYPRKIAEVKCEIAATKSDKRRRDLKKYLSRLLREQREYKMYMRMSRKKAIKNA